MSDLEEEPRAKRFDTIEEGFTIGLGLIVVGTFASLFILLAALPAEFYPGAIPVVFWGFIQLIYMIPAIVLARLRHRPSMAKGLLLVSAGAFLLNATCFGAFMIIASIQGG